MLAFFKALQNSFFGIQQSSPVFSVSTAVM